jgi:multidrug efflux system membrane fusion protein
MDERTRRNGDELAPNLRPTTPDPGVRSRSFSKTRIIIGAIVVVFLVIAGYGAVHFFKASPAPSGRFQNAGAQSVGAATVGTGNVRVIVNALGTVTPLATITVQTQISGQLVSVGFTEGQLVNKGDFLAQVDDRPYQIAKAQAEGQLAHDQGLLAQAKMDLTRYQTLAQQNSIARQQAEDQVFIVQQYEGSVKQDQANVDTQALDIAYCRIVSPITGRVGLRLVDPGNYVQTSGSTGLAVLTELQPISVIFSVPEDDLPQILPQLASGTPMQVTIYDRANVRQLATGQVYALDNQIDTTTGTVKVRAQFANTDNALFPNQFVNAQLLLQTLQNVITVPTSAVQLGARTAGANSDSGNPGSTQLASPSSVSSSPSYYVYVLDADGTVAVRQIVIGPTDGTMTAVNSGLTAGEKVVTDGTDRLRDGLHVSVSTLDGKPTDGSAGAGAGGQGGRRGGAGGQGGGTRENGGAGRSGERSQNSNRSQTQGTTNGGQ